MLRTYLTIALRQLAKGKLVSSINIAGLAVAIAACYFIMAYASFELSFEDFHANRESVYRVGLQQYENGMLKSESAKSYPGVYNFLNESIPEVQSATRFLKIPANTGFLFGYKDKMFNEWGGVINADTNFFKVFPALLVRGDINTVLTEPNSIVISESIARKVFGSNDPIGQRLARLEENGDAPLVVTGIIRDIPENSHFHAKFISKLEEVWPEIVDDDWNPALLFNYVLLKDHADPQSVSASVNRWLNGAAKNSPKIAGSQVSFQALSDIHLESQLKDEYETNGSKTLLYVVLLVGAMILAIGWINYINIEASRFLKRAREVGVRRIIGSRKSDLAFQFLVQFGCVNLLALIIAVVIVILIRPTLTTMTGISFTEIKLYPSPLLTIAVSAFVVGSLFVGIYPVIYLIRLNPVNALRGSFIKNPNQSFVRKPLLVVQFCASFVLVAFLLVINSQLDHMRTTNKKIEVDKVIAIRNPMAYANQEVVDKYNSFILFETKLLEQPSVGLVSTSSAIPGTEVGFTYVDLIKRTLNDPYDATRYKAIFVGEDFIPVYGIKLAAGRNFATTNETTWKAPWERPEWLKIILNEKAVNALGFKSPQEAINQVVKFKAFDDFEDYEIIGVVEDYHHEAVKKEILPMIFKLNFNSFQQVYYSIRLSAGSSPQQAIREIEQSWQKIFPDRPLEYFFIDDYYDQQFKSETRFSSVFTIFSGVAVFIAGLGILGMAYFEASARVKEISIRKVLGASGANLLALLSKEQIRCILIACMLAFPLVWYGTDLWLASYPSRVPLSPWIMILPVAIITGIVMVISLLQTVKAMAGNIVEHLKNE
jgi:putative ABC transport system permease protein